MRDDNLFVNQRSSKTEMPKMQCKIILIILSIIIFSLGTYGNGICSENQQEPEKTIVLSTGMPESMSHFPEIAGIYSEAFKRLGYRFRLVSLPGERSLVDANSGATDGEALRVSYLDSHKYPNLIQVSEPVKVLKYGAYSVDTSIKINGWESLKGKGYEVGIFKGIKFIEKKLPLYVKKENIIALSGFEQILKMLQARRIDIYIAATIMEESAPMKSDKYKDIVRVGIVEEIVIFPWLNKKHKALVPRLAKALEAMKADGTFQKIIEEVKQR